MQHLQAKEEVDPGRKASAHSIGHFWAMEKAPILGDAHLGAFGQRAQQGLLTSGQARLWSHSPLHPGALVNIETV